MTISGQGISGFAIVEEERYSTRRTTDVLSEKVHVIDNLDPGASRTIAVFSTIACDNEYVHHDNLRIFNSDGSATVRTVTFPSGFLVLINDYWLATYFLVAIGALVLLLILVAAITDVLTKAKLIEPKASAEAKPSGTLPLEKDTGAPG